MRHKTERIRIITMQRAIRLYRNRVDGPYFLRCLGTLMHQPEGRFFVWQGNVPALETQLWQSIEHLIDIGRINAQRHIGSIDPVLLQPIAMDRRGA